MGGPERSFSGGAAVRGFSTRPRLFGPSTANAQVYPTTCTATHGWPRKILSGRRSRKRFRHSTPACWTISRELLRTPPRWPAPARFVLNDPIHHCHSSWFADWLINVDDEKSPFDYNPHNVVAAILLLALTWHATCPQMMQRSCGPRLLRVDTSCHTPQTRVVTWTK